MWLPIIIAFILISLSSLYIILFILSSRILPPSPSELTFLTASSPNPQPLPSLSSPASCALSVIIPAYNEVLRLPKMLDEAIPYLEEHHSSRAARAAEEELQASEPVEDHPVVQGQEGYEILIVDDGSKDATTASALSYASAHPTIPIRVVTLEKNRGKGGAVKHGVLHSRGARILFVDADGATKFEDLRRVWKECARLERVGAGYACVVGSRAHLVGTDAVVKRSLIRNILMHGLHTILRTLGVGFVQDTQCGFKLFSRPLAQLLFPAQHVTHWMFDVELLILCSMLRAPVAEVPVGWHEVGGSKIRLVWDSLGMLKDLLVVRANYALGTWRVPRMPRMPKGEMNGRAK
ncbi:hypothetical protein DACRYDRAFT_49430 [Dacryopinax primogenitus]|uniref:dolichyl-phosphate beta-glucosyltransferase n=1 Tax=Dacryopinax primogenitus (strain DJM 731) TaxID=1858805 RepID=M5G524_DACPD|nr:uncharacterized protein DACRYDRAFT_49430 [Dacryopinax primogenitus]EJU03764.1 hypothetical protein DACRYDRAFT_49430 [Dacryopinax primogenitus]